HPDGAAPPTMKVLWDLVATRVNDELVAGVPSFSEVLDVVGYTGLPHDIEALLSRCRLAESFLADPQRAAVISFITLAEDEIAKATDSVRANHHRPVRSAFLRRTARHTHRKSQAKFFTTIYDPGFVEA